MAKMYPKRDDDLDLEGTEDMTEQEHKNSCDINLMIKNANDGLQIRGSTRQAVYGYDDTTLDAIGLRQEKQRLEAELQDVSQTQEFSDSELAMMPPEVAKKFAFKKKQDQKPNSTNDDKTTKQELVKSAAPKEGKTEKATTASNSTIE